MSISFYYVLLPPFPVYPYNHLQLKKALEYYCILEYLIDLFLYFFRTEITKEMSTNLAYYIL